MFAAVARTKKQKISSFMLFTRKVTVARYLYTLTDSFIYNIKLIFIAVPTYVVVCTYHVKILLTPNLL